MKKQKGMTLIEIVISLGIYGLLALLLTEIMSVVNNTMTATNQLNARLAFQARYADNKITTGLNRTATGDLTVSYGDNGTVIGSFNHIDDDVEDTRLEYNEYSGIYNNRTSRATIDYVEEINYRFMTFDYREEAAAGFLGPRFQVQVYLFPYFRSAGLSASEEATARTRAEALLGEARKIRISAGGNVYDPVSGELTSAYTIDIPNAAAAKQYVQLGDDGLPLEHVEFQIQNIASSPSETDREISNRHPSDAHPGDAYEVKVEFLDSSDVPIVEIVPTDIYMYVKRGNTESYYNECAVALDMWNAVYGDTDVAMRVCRSKASVGGEGIFDGYSADEVDPPMFTESDDPDLPEDPGEEEEEG